MRDKLGRGQAVSVEEALNFVLSNIPDAEPSKSAVPLLEAFGRVLGSDITAQEDLPGFTRSIMDGYAVRASDTFGATEPVPAYMKAPYEIGMGQEPDFELKPGEAAGIATGGMIPPGADAVVMFEYVQALGDGTIEVQAAVAPGENVIQRGEDAALGSLVLPMGRRLRPHDVSVLAGLGITEVKVFQRPRVAIISTGDEVVPAERKLGPGQIRDTNSYNLAGLILDDGGEPVRRGIVGDEQDVLAADVASAAEAADVVLITGGSSVGARDHAESVIVESGRLIFHSVSLRPGKPLLFGLLNDGTPVFGLPGHPRAVSVCYETFVRPALLRLSGRKPEIAEHLVGTVRASLTRGVHSAPGRQEVISVALSEGPGGELKATPVLGKSGLIKMLLQAQGTITVPAGTLGHEEGEVVDVRLF